MVEISLHVKFQPSRMLRTQITYLTLFRNKVKTRTYTIRIPTPHATFFSDIFESEQILVSFIVFIETCAHTLLRPNVWQTVHVYSCAVYSCSCSWGCLVERRERHVQGDVPINIPGVVQLCSGGCANYVAGVVPGCGL